MLYNVSRTSGQLLGTRSGKVAGSSCMLLEEVVPTYHVSRTPGKLLEEDVTTYHVSGTSCKLLDEDVTTYQERLASYFQMLRRTFWGGPFRSRPCSIPVPDPEHSWLPQGVLDLWSIPILGFTQSHRMSQATRGFL